MRRDLDKAVTIDVSRTWEKDRLLPFGRLREPWTALNRADFIIASKVKNALEADHLASKLARWEKPFGFCRPVLKAPVWVSGPRVQNPRKAVSFSGLGNNEAFADNLNAGQWTVIRHLAFPDHHPFSRRDILHIRKAWEDARADNAPDESPVLLTTEKDYFRIRKLQYLEEWHDIPLAYIPMELQWLGGEEALIKALVNMKNEK
ncbi:MAG: tetraacyldisaccharide 4'-kinase [Bacteroidia bacterium]